MLFPARLRLTIGIAVTAFALLCPHARGDSEPKQPAAPTAPALSPEQEAQILRDAKAPPGSRVGLEIVKRTETGGKTTETKRGVSTAPSVHIEGDKLVFNVDGKPTEMSLDSLGLVKSAGFTSSGSAEVSGSVWWKIGCFGFAALCAAAAVVCLMHKPLPLIGDALAFGAGSAAGVGCAFLGLLGTVCVGGALALVFGALYLLRTKGGATASALLNETKSAYNAIVDGVALSGPSAAGVMASIKQQAEKKPGGVDDAAHIMQTAAANGNPLNLS